MLQAIKSKLNYTLLVFLLCFITTCLCSEGSNCKSVDQKGDTFANRSDISSLVPQDDSLITELKIGAVTWNLAEKSPTLADCAFIEELTNGSCDIIALGIQECEDIRPRRKEGRRSRKWRELRNKYLLPKKFTCLAEHKLGGMQLAVYMNKNAKRVTKGVQTIEISCGVGNILSNKGAICVLLRLDGKRTLALVNAHLAAHQNKVDERNANYARIVEYIADRAHKKWIRRVPKSKLQKIKSLSTSKRSKSRPTAPQRITHPLSSLSTAKKSTTSLSNLFDAVLFFGDLNYRMEIPRLEIELFCDKYLEQPPSSPNQTIHSNKKLHKKLSEPTQSNPKRRLRIMKPDLIDDFGFEEIFHYDQLRREILFGNAFHHFKEAPISFPPTFKYDKKSAVFDSSNKARCPAWTDRVLYYSSGDLALEPTEYCSFDSRSSDHRPVCGIFSLFIPKASSMI